MLACNIWFNLLLCSNKGYSKGIVQDLGKIGRIWLHHFFFPFIIFDMPEINFYWNQTDPSKKQNINAPPRFTDLTTRLEKNVTKRKNIMWCHNPLSSRLAHTFLTFQTNHITSCSEWSSFASLWVTVVSQVPLTASIFQYSWYPQTEDHHCCVYNTFNTLASTTAGGAMSTLKHEFDLKKTGFFAHVLFKTNKFIIEICCVIDRYVCTWKIEFWNDNLHLHFLLVNHSQKHCLLCFGRKLAPIIALIMPACRRNLIHPMGGLALLLLRYFLHEEQGWFHGGFSKHEKGLQKRRRHLLTFVPLTVALVYAARGRRRSPSHCLI